MVNTPTNDKASGSVASRSVGAICVPTKAELAIIMDVEESIKAWHIAKNRIFFLIKQIVIKQSHHMTMSDEYVMVLWWSLMST